MTPLFYTTQKKEFKIGIKAHTHNSQKSEVTATKKLAGMPFAHILCQPVS